MATGASEPNRDVYFGATSGWTSVPIVNRQALIGATTDGPFIVEEYDSTTVVPPNWNATVDQWSNIILEKVD
jgi:N-methylhydantoinase A